jgi:hypothetical protein
MRRAWAVVWLVAGCGSQDPDLYDSITYETVESLPQGSVNGEGQLRGPGQWYPHPGASAQAVDISLVTSGLMRGETTRANGRGDHVTFVLGGNACEVDATTGNMDTDTQVAGSDIEVNDVRSNGDFLVVTTTGVYEVSPDGLGGFMNRAADVDSLLGGEFSAARYVGDEVFAVTPGCEVQLPDQGRVALSPEVCDDLELASTGDALVLASAGGTLLVDELGAVVIDPLPSQHVATVGPSVFVIEDTRVRALSGGWQHELGAEVVISDLLAAQDLGLVIVEVSVAGVREARVLDAWTGERLGHFELSEDTLGLDVSPQGGLLLQLRPDDAISWRITR